MEIKTRRKDCSKIPEHGVSIQRYKVQGIYGHEYIVKM